jgi:hypothetical protein
MKSTTTAGIFAMLFLVLSCRDDEPNFAPITGKWRGTLAELEVKPLGIPIPITHKDENFAPEIEFTSDGTVTFLNDSPTVQGTYRVNGDQLTTDLDFNLEMIEPTDPYKIRELTKTTLIIYLEKTGTIQDPETGNEISGDIKVTLHFARF